jgi:hypothetical protein
VSTKVRRIPKGSYELVEATKAVEPDHGQVVLTSRGGAEISPDKQRWVYSDRDQFRTQLQKFSKGQVAIGFNGQGSGSDFSFDGDDFEIERYASVDVSGSSSMHSLSLKNVSTKKLSLSARQGVVENCKALRFDLNFASGHFVFKNCHFGIFHLNTGSVGGATIRLENCSVCQISLSSDPNLRDLQVTGSTFSTRSERVENDLIGDIEPWLVPSFDRASYEILYDWAVKQKNSGVAHIARGAELAVDRFDSKGIYWLALVLWGWLSNYSLAPLRPILWLLGAMVVFGFVLFCTGTSLGVDSTTLTGWRQGLIGYDFSARVTRAVVGVFEGIGSPLSVLGVRKLVVPDSPWVALVQLLYGIFCISLFFLFFSSLRRRFRI